MKRGKRLAAFAVLASVIAAFGLVPASSTSAQGSGQLFWDDDGSAFATFGPNESVSIAFGTIGFSCDAFFPTADIYVMSSPPPLGGALADISGAPNTVFGATGGLFSDTIAFTQPGGNLGEGTWTVVYDECQDGDVDPEDTIFPNAFAVRPLPVDVPPVDASIQALKLQSGSTAERYENLGTVIDSIEKAQELNEMLDQVVSCIGGLGACIVGMIVDELQEQLIEQVKIALGLPTADPKVLARDVLADNIKHYRAIEADPPDPAFTSPTTLESVDTLAPESSDAITIARFDLANAQAQEAALAEALLHSIERYQGAALADSGAWGREHAKQARAFAGLLAAQTLVTSDRLDTYRDAVSAESASLDEAATKADDALDALAASGLPTDARRDLLGLGFDQTQIAQAMGRLPTPDAFDGFATADALAAIDAAVAGLTDLRGALEETTTQLDGVIAALDADPLVPTDAFPTATAGGPYAAAAGSSIALAGETSDPQGSDPTVAWDLDRDGDFDDATGTTPTVSFPETFDGLIGMQATDADGHVAVAYARTTIDGGSPPAASFTPSGSTVQTPIGGSAPFNASATDADDDPIAIAWRLDGTDVAAAPDFVYTSTASDAGPHLLEALVSDGTTTLVHRWTVVAVHPDADGDGWRANVDCDDSLNVRNPGLAEIGGNGIDDDCEALTTDDQDVVGDGNIVANGNAETGNATLPPTVVPVPAWETYGKFTLSIYNAPEDASPVHRNQPPGPTDFGNQYFYGGNDESYSTATQLIDVSGSAGAIDSGAITFDQSAWIGGWYDQEDWGKVHATFLDATNAPLATSTLGPVTVADRGVYTKLLFRSTSGSVPVGTRKVRVVMEAMRFSGANNDGWFDNIYLSLNGPGLDPVAPTLEPVGDLVVAEGSSGSVMITAAGSDDIALTASGVPSYATFTDHGDGTATLDASPADDAEASVVVSACSSGRCVRRVVRIDGVNVAPDALATSAGPITAGESSTITAAQNDPGADTFEYAFDCDGDGTHDAFQSAAATDCAFASAGAYEVGVQVRDDDGGVGTASTNVLVRPVIEPVAEIARVDQRNEGSFVQLDGRASMVADGSPLTFAWEQTGGPPVTLSGTSVTRPSFIAPDNGTYTFRLVVTAGEIASAPDDVAVEARNVAPSLALTNDGPVSAGAPAHITVTTTDPGSADTHTYAFDCEDDGTFGAEQTAASTSCTFASAGDHIVRARVTDDDGGVGTGETTVQVEGGQACGVGLFDGFFSPVDNPEVINVANAGRTVPMKYQLTCPDGAPVDDPAHLDKLTSAKVPCGTFDGDGTDAVETYAGASGLIYIGNGNWHFNWATPKSYASTAQGPCRVMTLRFSDGSTRTANFRFK